MEVEIIENQDKLGFTPGTLMTSWYGTVVLCVGDGENQHMFSGVVLIDPQYPPGKLKNDWFKSAFTAYRGEILLKQ